MISKKRFAQIGLLAVPSVVAAVAVATAGLMYHRVRAFDAKNKCDVLAVLSADEMKKALEQKQSKASSTAEASTNGVATAASAALAVTRVEYDGDRELAVVFNERPDMEVVRNYVEVGPLLEGHPSFRYTTPYSCRTKDYEPTVRITGEFAYRTNLTLRIRKGFPLYGKGVNPLAEGALSNDFVHVFRRNDPMPCVTFGDGGRYLPPGGRQAIRVEAISVTNVATEIRRVEPRNIVQLLAREEGSYRRTGWSQISADSEDTDELAGLCETGILRCVNRLCQKETVPFPVAMNDGGSARGVYLLAVRSADWPRDEDKYGWFVDGWGENPKYNPNRYRLVCLSDLGLSVRQGKDGLGVWVTSLTSGRPVAEARVEVYSSANILLAAGATDANGWCAPPHVAKGEPFAVVVWTPSDMTFMAFPARMRIDETHADGARPEYLAAAELDAFAWTERGIYRHDEPIFVHAILRNGARRAPAPLPVVLTLKSPKGNVLTTKTLMTDADGALAYDGFRVPAEQPSGKWTIQVSLPGAEDGESLVTREIKVEEFAPPQIRVRVAAEEGQNPSNFAFRVSAEHFFGGPARALACEGAVVFEDVPFAPAPWKGFTFGNDSLGLKPCFRRLAKRVLDGDGACVYEAPLWADSGRPKAAVRATGQGIVFEDGGRPATARKSLVCHYYPYYLGANLPSWLKLSKTSPTTVDFVCVAPDGALIAQARRLVAKIERIDSVYSYRTRDDGQSTWDCERIRTTVAEEIPIAVDASGRARYTLPLKDCGDYVLTVADPTTGVSFGRTFYLSDWGDDVVRAPLSDPTAVAIRTDKAFYRDGERPRLVVKAPFAGFARLSVMRDDVVYEEILNLTNATSEVVLRPVERAWTPNVDVAISVVQGVSARAKHLAARAHGTATVCVRPVEDEIDVTLDAAVAMPRGEAAGREPIRVTVDVAAPRATTAVVTLVDEGINLLTDERLPNPRDWLGRPREGWHPIYDLYGHLLPVVEDGLRASGLKTGGGFGAEMLGRVSPVPTRRFKPLAQWKAKVALANGKGRTVFELPPFVGEVRVTAVAYSATATGAACVQKKVAPKLILQPDAPRFVAPGDTFAATMTLRNASGTDGAVQFSLGGVATGEVFLRTGESTNLVFANVRACPDGGKLTGTQTLAFAAQGLDERHETTIELPVRPAVAWRSRSEVVRLDPGPAWRRAATGEAHRFAVSVGASPLADFASALDWLADYPHGCLEQTASRVFPLIAAGGILNSVATNRADVVAAGVRRVESMVRTSDFVVWPDCTSAPWDREVSLYAAHFLVEAKNAGHGPRPQTLATVLGFLKKWSLDTNDCVSAYACHTLARAGQVDKDRMLRLYDRRTQLDALSRARLARAFAATHDRARAAALLAYALNPQSVKEAAFQVLARIDLDPNDAQIPTLIDYLTAHRDKERLSWGTTAENAHALLAIGAYYQHHPVRGGEVRVGVCGGGADDGPTLGARAARTVDAAALCLTNRGAATAFVTVREQWLNDPQSETNEANGISLSRRYLRPDGTPADLTNLLRGEMLVVELTLTSDMPRIVSDLVIEDLFPGAFEPVHRELDPRPFASGSTRAQVEDWVLRMDARDDRMLVFSKPFELKKDYDAKVFYPVRVVSAGSFTLPGPSVEGMYHPQLRARLAPGRLVVRP